MTAMRSRVTQFRLSLVVTTLLATVSSYANAQGLPPLAHLTVGSEFKYTVKAWRELGQHRRSQWNRKRDLGSDERTQAKDSLEAGTAARH
jgi:hypothetical protein